MYIKVNINVNDNANANANVNVNVNVTRIFKNKKACPRDLNQNHGAIQFLKDLVLLHAQKNLFSFKDPCLVHAFDHFWSTIYGRPWTMDHGKSYRKCSFLDACSSV